MWADLKLAQQGGFDRRRAILCVALVAALLYNPFLTVLSSSFDLSAQHPLSYRATVASSELRRCTLAAEKPLIPALVTVLFFLDADLIVSHEFGVIQVSDCISPGLATGSDGIWFRPPPTA